MPGFNNVVQSLFQIDVRKKKKKDSCIFFRMENVDRQKFCVGVQTFLLH